MIPQTALSKMRIEQPVYENSAPLNDAWGQPPASYYAFTMVNGVMQGQLIAGVYQTAPSSGQAMSPEEKAHAAVIWAIETTLQEDAEIWKELAKH